MKGLSVGAVIAVPSGTHLRRGPGIDIVPISLNALFSVGGPMLDNGLRIRKEGFVSR